MVTVRKEISLEIEVDRMVKEKTASGELCLSKFVNNKLRERYKDELR